MPARMREQACCGSCSFDAKHSFFPFHKHFMPGKCPLSKVILHDFTIMTHFMHLLYTVTHYTSFIP
uniref:Uncharacterized protein n=1 Tax=Anguilla anguilla TaxID=7936 RepID=A0A0E9U438_ANGAN